eukprot:NODE_1280_length_1011_cov_236.887734_g890_i0.p1 GENE.NODE_1280_length_1011_cov_236.887734_g890_i0~~NODE_1280_length_1011_cov_236.887734_g890_i0.p1  ORF type:complete len:173 (+),score=54.64 NODE_1280_length_1011_cov_236.887734_g890_i0:23-520(+)
MGEKRFAAEREALIKEGKIKLLSSKQKEAVVDRLQQYLINLRNKQEKTAAAALKAEKTRPKMKAEEMTSFVDRIYYAQRKKDEVNKERLIKLYVSPDIGQAKRKLTKAEAEEMQTRLYAKEMEAQVARTAALSAKYLASPVPVVKKPTSDLLMASTRLYEGHPKR